MYSAATDQFKQFVIP